MVIKYIFFWIGAVVIAIINGTIRQFTYGKMMRELSAHQLSCLTGIILFGIYIWILGIRWKLESSSQAVIIGLIWVALTIAFEFLFGHYVVKDPWSRLLYDYNILQGRLWILVLIWIAIAPYVIFKLQSK